MNFKRFGRTANLFDKTTADLNYFINSGTGEKERLTNYFATDYIRVESGETYYWQDVQLRNNAGAFYDSNKEYVSGLNTNTLQTYYFTIPTGCEYVRLTGSSSHIEDTMLNAGSTALPYQPYKDWNDIQYYIHSTSTDTIATPAVLYLNDTTATVGLKGDMQQSGTPTPDSPIQPSECGERTGNLLDVNASISGAIKGSPYSAQDYGTIISSQYTNTSDYIPITPNTQYTFRCNNQNPSATASRGYAFYDDNKQVINIESNTLYDILDISTLTVTTPNTAAYMRISWDINATNLMLNLGSTALPCEPYGYKIPILSNSTTTTVYLGEVQSTRRIKKLVLTGEEKWYKNDTVSTDNTTYVYTTAIASSIDNYGGFCSHFVYDSGSYNHDYEGFSILAGYGSLRIRVDNNIATTATAFKAYLATQYAAGTPVCVWYILATPETAVVNEPIRKIGDYADEVSGITIPTIAGANTLSIGTTVQPSEVTATYKGWHPVADVHEAENGQWD